jgi:hypothetical protein
MKNVSGKAIVAALTALLLAMAGCAKPPVIERFPVQLEPAATVLTALLPGTLGVRDGYLAVNNDIILWPYGFTLDTSGKVPRVLDGNGNEAARYGEKIVLGGGSIAASWAEEKVGMDLPDGAYWLTGNVVPREEWPGWVK